MRTYDIETKYFDQRRDESLELPKCNMKHNLNDQSTANCIIGIDIRTAGLLPSFIGVPFCNSLIIESKSDASSIYQGLIILLPVADMVAVFF